MIAPRLPLSAGPAAILPLMLACASVPAARFDQPVATSFANSPMRKLTTAQLEVYYPAGSADAARLVAARMEDCLIRLRARARTQRPHPRALVYLTDANYNNAYVSGLANGEPLHTVDPLYATSEAFHLDGLSTAAIGEIACHELLHYVQDEQIEGLWRVVNAVFGNVFPPQAFLERWFTEGLAQYYEGRLGKTAGRPHSPLYRAQLAAGLASRGGWISAGDLSLAQRELYPSSGAYLTGLHFIEYLARTHGEEKLWELIDLQGRSVFSPFGVVLRFKSVFGASLGALIDQWSLENQSVTLERKRPADQRVLLEAVGYDARLASAPDGTMAVISAHREEVPMLRLLEPDGRLRAEQRLARFIPVRQWVSAGPQQTSGMSFTADSRWLYLMNDDLTSIGDSRAQLWKVDARTAEVVRVWPDIGGLGGAIHPGGARYLFIELSAGRSELTELDLGSGERTPLTTHSAGVTYAAPAWSPGGTRIAFSRLGEQGWDLWLREADGSVRALTSDGEFNYGPRWIDEQRLVFLRQADGRAQAHQLDLTTGALSIVTDAAFSAFDATPLPGGQLAFLDRDGWSWSLAAAPLTARARIERPPEPALPASLPPPPALVVEADEPYHPAEGLFIPLLRVPSLIDLSSRCTDQGCTINHAYGFALGGRDRLSFHNWSLVGTIGFPALDLAVYGSYTNQTQAPWSITASAGYDTHHSTDDRWGDGRVGIVSAALAISRAVFTTPIGLAFGGFHQTDTNRGPHHFFGPSLGFDYFAGESTAYGGLKRALGVRGQLSLYPPGLSSLSVADLDGGLTLALPLPILARHSLLLWIDGRALYGAPAGALQVGGVSRDFDLLRFNARKGEEGPDIPLPQPFSIPVRGYEDYSVRANQALAGAARYRYPFVIDRGFASILYLLPSILFRQTDLDLFGAAALTDSAAHPWLRALGASLALRMLIGGAVPLSIYYRFAVRLDERLPPLHSLGFAFE